jgi:hypothetical protein
MKVAASHSSSPGARDETSAEGALGHQLLVLDDLVRAGERA